MVGTKLFKASYIVPSEMGGQLIWFRGRF